MTLPPDPTLLSSSEKDALIAALLAQVQTQAEQIAVLTARVAELEAKLDLPPKTPDNSSLPPSRGQKTNGDGSKAKPKSKAHPGAHRPRHPNPTSRRDVWADECPHCHADVRDVLQVAVQSYDRIEIPEITPEVTRVTLHGGVCPCCTGRFKAPPPAGLEPGSPFGPNLRAFVVYL